MHSAQTCRACRLARPPGLCSAPVAKLLACSSYAWYNSLQHNAWQGVVLSAAKQSEPANGSTAEQAMGEDKAQLAAGKAKKPKPKALSGMQDSSVDPASQADTESSPDKQPPTAAEKKRKPHVKKAVAAKPTINVAISTAEIDRPAQARGSKATPGSADQARDASSTPSLEQLLDMPTDQVLPNKISLGIPSVGSASSRGENSQLDLEDSQASAGGISEEERILQSLGLGDIGIGEDDDDEVDIEELLDIAENTDLTSVLQELAADAAASSAAPHADSTSKHTGASSSKTHSSEGNTAQVTTSAAPSASSSQQQPKASTASSSKQALRPQEASARGPFQDTAATPPWQQAASAAAAADPMTPDASAGTAAVDVDPDTRRYRILLDLLNSSGNEQSQRIAQFVDEIDEQMLQLLETRYKTEQAYDKESPNLAKVEDLYRRLKYLYNRKNASPSMRLLDEVLELLGDDPDAEDYESRRRDAVARMRLAFTGGAADVDIFTAAEALGERKALAAQELSVEYVRVHEFIAETSELIKTSKSQTADLERQIATASAQVDAALARDPRAKDDPAVRQQVVQIQLAKQVVEARTTSFLLLDDVAILTRFLEQQQFGGSMPSR